jgi:hypothetical protein
VTGGVEFDKSEGTAMSNSDLWKQRRTRASALAADLLQLSAEQIGTTTAELQYKRALRQAFHHAQRAEEAAEVVQMRLERMELPPTPLGVTTSASRIAMVVRFACDLLCWTPQQAANFSQVTVGQFHRVRDAYATPEVMKRVLDALTQHGIDVAQLTQYVDKFLTWHERVAQQTLSHGQPAPEMPPKTASHRTKDSQTATNRR